MKIQFLIAFLLTLFVASLCADEGRGDTGTLKLSWNEFRSLMTERGGLAIGKGFFNTNMDTEWTEYEVRMTVSNKGSKERKVRMIISIFDKTNNLVFAASKDKSIEGLAEKEFKCETKISSAIKFEPETVFIRCWWE